MSFWWIRPLLLAFVALMPLGARAQNPPTSADAAGQQLLRPEELEALVAPIALYPDRLLAEVLMASTYPIELVQAERWVNENKQLSGDKLLAAAEKQPWDQSVKSLIATPSVLEMMSTKLDWTHKLGNAVLAQQSDVMAAVQRLRSRAQANNKLTSSKEQTVTVTQEHSGPVIAIESTDPGTVYVPYYDPNVVYGSWPYADYPPYYFGVPGYIGAGVIATGIAFGAGYALWRWGAGAGYWGGRINWGGGGININRGGNRVTHWQHDVRRGGGLRTGANRPRVGNRPTTLPSAHRARVDRANAARRSSSRVSHARSGRTAGLQSQRGARHGSINRGGGARRAAAYRGGGVRAAGGGGRRAGAYRGGGVRAAGRFRGGGRGGGVRAGGGSRGGGRGGGRRSDARLKHDIVLLGRLDNGLGFYRYAYNGSNKAYVGVIAQEVQTYMPEAVARGSDGYLRVFYDKLGLPFQTYERWIASGRRIPTVSPPMH
jgi:hypothetical protein